VSNTPRTDAAIWNSQDRSWMDGTLCRQLERELNAANERIKRLEEAGDALKSSGYFGGFGDAVNKWIKAKEDKP
jgi:hypothetical protein